MSKKSESKTIEQLMAEADELIQQFNSDFLNDMEEGQRLQFEKHTQNLKNIKSEVQDRVEEKRASEIGSGAEGMHEAIQDIVKAFREFDKDVF